MQILTTSAVATDIFSCYYMPSGTIFLRAHGALTSHLKIDNFSDKKSSIDLKSGGQTAVFVLRESAETQRDADSESNSMDACRRREWRDAELDVLCIYGNRRLVSLKTAWKRPETGLKMA